MFSTPRGSINENVIAFFSLVLNVTYLHLKSRCISSFFKITPRPFKPLMIEDLPEPSIPTITTIVWFPDNINEPV
ncbi:hypothetical protein HanIR_Chr01g0044501 [Helianthus annuus]|nr:hypothetical protein HanIR_Chr01g0044501 [Helianthus annuus]